MGVTAGASPSRAICLLARGQHEDLDACPGWSEGDGFRVCDFGLVAECMLCNACYNGRWDVFQVVGVVGMARQDHASPASSRACRRI